MDYMILLLWCALLSYSTSFIPQIITNYRTKSTQGLSDLFVFLYSVGYVTLLCYIFALDLLFPYKIMVPIETSLCGVLIFQRLYYHENRPTKLFVIALGTVLSFVIASLPYLMQYPFYMGHVFGWISTGAFSINQLPQVYKVYKAKSTHGFSFIFVSFIALAMFLELIAAIAKELPLQTILMDVRGVIVYVIFCCQFALYRKNR